MPIAVYCNCGNTIQVSVELAGRKIRCKACSEVLLIPEVPLEASSEDPDEEESEASEYEVVGEKTATRTCSSCGATATVADTACLACGADLASGDISLGVLEKIPRSVLLGGAALILVGGLVLGIHRLWSASRPGAFASDGYGQLEAGDLRAAERSFRKALEYDSNYADAVVGLARVGVRGGDSSLIRKFAPHAIKLLDDPTDRATLRLAFAWNLLAEQDPERASELARAAAEDEARVAGEAEAVLGLAALATDQPDEALEHLEAAHRSSYADVRVGRALATLYQERGRPVDARAAAERAVQLDDQDADLWRLLADLRQATDDLPGARAALDRAIGVAPNDAALHARLANVFLAQGAMDEALTAAEEAARLDPSSPEAAVSVGRILLARSEASRAVEALEGALELGAGWEAEFLLGKALILGGDASRGLRRIQTALQRNDSGATELYLEAAQLALDHGEARAATNLIVRALNKDPDDYDAHLLAAHALASADLGRRRNDEAIRTHLGEALRIDPNRREAHLALGRHFFETLRPEEAMAAFDRGLSHHPKDPELLYYKGWAGIRARKWDAAIEALEACDRIAPGFRDLDERLRQAREGKFYD